jgi:hypothetical protein
MDKNLEKFITFLNKKLVHNYISEGHILSIILGHLSSKDVETTFGRYIRSNCVFGVTKKMRPVFDIRENVLGERYISSLRFYYVNDDDLRENYVTRINEILKTINYESLTISSFSADLSKIENIKF